MDAMVAVPLETGVDEALQQRRAYAFVRRIPINDVAGDLVARRIRFD